MDVFKLLFILILTASALPTKADQFTDCLRIAMSQEHRIEKLNSIRSCFQQYKFSTSKDICYNSIKNLTNKIDSIKLSEELTATCFYEVKIALDIKTCLKESSHFKIAINHDEAVFYCYQEFQNKLNKSECLKTANSLIFPAKKDYLRQHCLTNTN